MIEPWRDDLRHFIADWDANRSLLRAYPALQHSIDEIVAWVRKRAAKRELRLVKKKR